MLAQCDRSSGRWGGDLGEVGRHALSDKALLALGPATDSRASFWGWACLPWSLMSRAPLFFSQWKVLLRKLFWPRINL